MPRVPLQDTFLDAAHVREAFPSCEVHFANQEDEAALRPPFRITFPPASASEEAAAGPLVVEAYTPPNPGPYPQDQPPRNAVRFTSVQVRRPPAMG